jgi:hypothetical protein
MSQAGLDVCDFSLLTFGIVMIHMMAHMMVSTNYKAPSLGHTPLPSSPTSRLQFPINQSIHQTPHYLHYDLLKPSTAAKHSTCVICIQKFGDVAEGNDE